MLNHFLEDNTAGIWQLILITIPVYVAKCLESVEDFPNVARPAVLYNNMGLECHTVAAIAKSDVSLLTAGRRNSGYRLACLAA